MQRKLSVLPIVLGVSLAFYGDMSFTAVGAFYTFFCVILAALKAVMGGELLTVPPYTIYTTILSTSMTHNQ